MKNKDTKKNDKIISRNNTLSLQRDAIRKISLDCLYSAIFFTVIILIIILTGTFDEELEHRLSIVVPLLSIFPCIFFYLFVRRFNVYKRIRNIKYSSEEKRVIKCKKTSFISHPISKSTYAIFCIILTDKTDKKYYYVFEESFLSYTAKADLKNKLENRNLDLICYRGTEIIKYLPKKRINEKHK